MYQTDPIVAISSPPGRSLRGLVRISGDKLDDAFTEHLQPRPQERHLTPTRLVAMDLPVLAVWFAAPRSYTGRDVLEIQLPGHPALLERVMHWALAVLRAKLGEGRFAEPGEFTQRAFLAGRIDLTQAEGIAATIAAESDAQLQAARLLRSGRLGGWAVDLVDQLAQRLALVEAGADFIDQDGVVPIRPGELDDALAALAARLEQMLRHSRAWSAIESLPWVVIAGPPNAGKSTLFNALLGRPRTVTSAIAGTTRDVVCEPLRMADGAEGAEVMLVDMAGLDEPATALDRAMQHQAHEALDRAELILLVRAWDDKRGFSPLPDDVPLLRVMTKADLQPDEASSSTDATVLAVSAATGQGLDDLRGAIKRTLGERAVSLSSGMLALTPRHYDAMTVALQAVHEARDHLAGQRDHESLDDMELIAALLRQAMDALAGLGGRMTPDDVLGKIFSTFCIGK